MKKLLKSTLIIAALLFINSLTIAQENPQRRTLSPEERAEKRSFYLKGKLNLSDQQTADVKNIILKKEQNLETVKGQRKEKREEFDSEITKILNNDQLVKYNEMKAERKEKMKEKNDIKQNAPSEQVK